MTTAIAYDPADNRSGLTVSGVTALPSAPNVASAGFEVPDLPAGDYRYGPTDAPGATFGGNAGITSNNSAWAFAPAPQGDQVAFLQQINGSAGSITLDVTGLTVGQTYAFKMQASMRPYSAVNPIQLSFQGASIGSITPTSTNFAEYSSATFVAASTSGQLVLAGTASGGDTSSGIDAVSVVVASPSAPAGTIANASFETPGVGGSFQYNPNYSDQYYFGGAAGIAANGSAWGFSDAPDGGQVGFLQSDGSVIAFNVSGLIVGASYVVRFSTGRRYYYPPNTIQVSFSGISLGQYSPASMTWQQITTASFVATSSTGVLSFAGLTPGGDYGSGIDAISISGP